MIIEMRTYLLKPTTVAAFKDRFAEGLQHRAKLSPLGAFWESDIGTLNQVIHVWPYKDFEDRERIGAEARKTGHWPPKTQEFVLTQESKFLQAASFSPPLEPRELGNVYEIRTYTYQPGTIPKVLERWEKVVAERVSLSPLAACWYSTVGPLNQFIHIWPYRDMAERARIRQESMKLTNWPPRTAELLLKQENTIVFPASFSPLR